MPYILSPEQKVVVDAMISNETSSTKYFDIYSALQALCKSCTLATGKGKKVLIHIPDAQTKAILKSMMDKIGLSDISIDITEPHAIPEIDIIKLRSTLKKEKDSDALVTFVLANKKANKLKETVSNYFLSFDKEVMANTPFRDFAANVIYNKKPNRPQLTISTQSDKYLQFNASEYYKVKKEIKTASELYRRQYDLFDHLSLFKKEIWADINKQKIQLIKTQLNEFRNESATLANDFVSISNSLFENSSQDLKNAFSILNQKFLSHEESCTAYHIKSSSSTESKDGIFSIFKKKKTQPSNKVYIEAFDELSGLIEKISSEWYEELEAPTDDMISFDYIIEFIEKNQQKVNIYKTKITKNLEQSVQRINKINTSSKEVSMIDIRLEKLIKAINDSNLFDIDLEHNILSFLKQSELSHNIASYIEKCHILFHSSAAYLDWKSFYNATGDIFQLIFKELKKLPPNTWLESFENWYEQKLQKNVLGDVSISSIEMKDYFEQAKLAKNSEVQSLIAQLHDQRIEGSDGLKSEAKELYNTLFKKKQLPNVSWNNTALMNLPFMQSFFPIHIAESLTHTKEYDLVISFTKKEDATDSKIHYFSPIERKDIENLAENKHNFLYLNSYNYNGLLKNLSSTDKLKAAKKLAKYILSLNQNIKIYQLKSANIISLLPAYDDAKLEQELDTFNAKAIDTTGVLYDRLTESILFTNRNPFIIIKDELINSELHDHTLWQLKILKTFEEVGYEIISLNTSEQLNDNQSLFEKMMWKIGGNIDTQIETKSLDSDKPEVVHEEG